jgi:hypothetical protein
MDIPAHLQGIGERVHDRIQWRPLDDGQSNGGRATCFEVNHQGWLREMVSVYAL